ncbi:MAG: 3-hydroxyacyl-CoA dehydrogenase family protein, partial [Candidatus Binatota bacterium]
PVGPLRWADQIGLDEVLAVLEGLQQETGEERYRPAPLLKKMVLAGWLGESAGRGFYSYTESKVTK